MKINSNVAQKSAILRKHAMSNVSNMELLIKEGRRHVSLCFIIYFPQVIYTVKPTVP